MEFPSDLKYTKEHEWAKVEGKAVLIGITDYAQEELGDIVYVELPEVDEEIAKAEDLVKKGTPRRAMPALSMARCHCMRPSMWAWSLPTLVNRVAATSSARVWS